MLVDQVVRLKSRFGFCEMPSCFQRWTRAARVHYGPDVESHTLRMCAPHYKHDEEAIRQLARSDGIAIAFEPLPEVERTHV